MVSYWLTVVSCSSLIAVKADTLSLTAYWLMMQIAMIIGFASAYPMNWWLIKKGIKEAM